MTTGSVIAGKADAGMIVNGPLPSIANAIASNPGFAFATKIACRKELAPPSALVVTV